MVCENLGINAERRNSNDPMQFYLGQDPGEQTNPKIVNFPEKLNKN
jgi:hypothetical protein